MFRKIIKKYEIIKLRVCFFTKHLLIYATTSKKLFFLGLFMLFRRQ